MAGEPFDEQLVGPSSAAWARGPADYGRIAYVTTDGGHTATTYHRPGSDGIIRPDGLLQHSMFVMQVKTPAESKGPWDYYKLVRTMSGEEAFGSLADSTCPLVKK